jgi:hypothetical protein
MPENNNKPIDEQINEVAQLLARKQEKLRGHQARWEDWEAGNVKQEVDFHVEQLKSLLLKRQEERPLESTRTSGIFYGGNF